MKSILTIMLFSFIVTVSYGQGFQQIKILQDPNAIKQANGVAVADYNQDGNLDIFIVAAQAYDPDDPGTWNRLLQGSAEGFRDVTIEAGLNQQYDKQMEVEMGIKMGVSWGDYDNDGFPDLFLTNHEDDQLWHNKGDGTFENVTTEAGIVNCGGCYSSSALWWDFNNDGFLDIYVSSWIKANRLYENNGDGTFTEKGEKSGLATPASTWTSVPLDINKDGFQDIYVVNDFGPNQFFLNERNGKFSEHTLAYGLFDSGDGMGVDICDYESDGNFDIYLTNIWQEDPNPFFVNNGQGVYSNKAFEANLGNVGWGWGARFFDMDHDMDEDLYVVNQEYFAEQRPEANRLFVSDNNVFTESGKSYGVDHYANARGLETFDYNKDGDLDLIVTNWDDEVLLYNNVIEEKGNWLQIALQGSTSNRDAFGTVLRIKTGENQYQHRLNHGANFLGQSIKPIHFGLGNHKTISELTIFWPSGRVEKIYNITTNQFLKFTEGEQEEVLGETYGTKGKDLITSLGEDLDVPTNKAMLQIFPHPITSSSVFRLDLPKPGNVELRIYDLLGREVHQESFLREASTMDLSWPEHLSSGSGSFYYQIITENSRIIKKVLKK
ncbi:FG-GAP-like repeat-containing protein [Fulvivirgaceae bacterium BMA10]|uniref:FG-GAP-like repeat-containing protein n=1 Tax=Splendidivirga corallicola TaxID=3051826 RepID=A0ABT8KN97_9BACT|nr:FG-GAP-like repeat-containing protein [Fulvivirgaceae bacterium BMA10]